MKTLRWVNVFVAMIFVCPTLAIAQKAGDYSQDWESRETERGTLDGDMMDEATMMKVLGIEPESISKIGESSEDDKESDAGIAFLDDVDPNSIFGPMACPSLIQTKNRFGYWQNAGVLDMCPMMENAWSFLGPQVEQKIREKLESARADFGPVELHGFYNIAISMNGPAAARKSVLVWGDRSTVHLFYEVPGNVIQCRADLRSLLGYPDRAVRITTKVQVEVVLQSTGNLASPTRVIEFVVRLRDTTCWNDGWAYRQTFNNNVIAAFNAESTQVPPVLGDIFYAPVNTQLAPFINSRTTGMLFDYAPLSQQLIFKLDSIPFTDPNGQFPIDYQTMGVIK